jgi:hypothetical protein
MAEPRGVERRGKREREANNPIIHGSCAQALHQSTNPALSATLPFTPPCFCNFANKHARFERFFAPVYTFTHIYTEKMKRALLAL